MFYRIRDNKVYDYADYEYAKDCFNTTICTMAEYIKYKKYYTVEGNELKLIPDVEEVIYQEKKSQFEKEFFKTSLGWIRRNVRMRDGSTKDFLSDLLLSIKAGLELGQNVEIITYKTPDFNLELTNDYMESLQELKFATMEFVQECLIQTVKDFRTDEGGTYGI